MSPISKNERMKLAMEAWNNGHFKSKTACSKAFDVPARMFQRRLLGMTAREETTANSRKLSDLEEMTLKRWIMDMAERGLPQRISQVRYLAGILVSARSKSSNTSTISAFNLVSERWVTRFVARHNDIQSKFNRQYDYQRAKCEDPQAMERWFTLVQNTMTQDIYNMYETGFQMGIISTAKVICGSETRNPDAKPLQPGNRKWITSIVTVNASGWVLPAQLIFAGKKHQSQWYSALPKDYRLSLSENGWTNDNLGLEWLQ